MKYCKCGCGQITKVISHTHSKLNRVKGEYNNYIHGHHIKDKGEPVLNKRIRMRLRNPMFYISREKKELWRKRLSDSTKGRIPWNPKGSKRLDILGNKHPRWKGGISILGGYVSILLPNGYRIKEHRLVMEKLLNRKLYPFEHVHHKNGIRNDNRIENLEVLDAKEHIKRYHSIATNRERTLKHRVA